MIAYNADKNESLFLSLNGFQCVHKPLENYSSTRIQQPPPPGKDK